jgi:hypothetical protein
MITKGTLTVKDLWVKRVTDTLSRNDATLRQLQQLAAQHEQTLENIIINIKKNNKNIREEIERSGQRIREAISWRNDPPVYIRNYNETNLEVFHGSLDCGYVNPRRVREMLLGEARSVGLRPCISCGHLASPRGNYDTAA